ncbi:MAG: hypothetical protein ACM3JD_00030, partial [Rudaea sp.]
MKPKTRFLLLTSLLFLALLLLSGGSVLAQTPAPTLTSDAADYPPGATVTLTGAGWQAGELVHISVTDIDYVPVHEGDVSADGSGYFVYQFNLPLYFVPVYFVTATGSSGAVATTSFTDLSIGTYDQCSNDTGSGYPSSSSDPGCQWINGNLNSNNSAYYEGDATVQRLWLTDLVPGSTHTVTFDYSTTKSGKHSYDFLTTWNWSENWITLADRCQGIDGCETVSETATDIPNDATVPATIEPKAPGSRQFVMRGGSLTGAAFVNPMPFSGSYSGDSYTRITVSFTVANSGDMCTTKGGTTTCGVALWFGAHVARTDQWKAAGSTGGAATINGSPYHVMLAMLDGASIGSRDNQMQSNTIRFDLEVAKTAAGTFDREYLWKI